MKNVDKIINVKSVEKLDQNKKRKKRFTSMYIIQPAGVNTSSLSLHTIRSMQITVNPNSVAAFRSQHPLLPVRMLVLYETY